MKDNTTLEVTGVLTLDGLEISEDMIERGTEVYLKYEEKLLPPRFVVENILRAALREGEG